MARYVQSINGLIIPEAEFSEKIPSKPGFGEIATVTNGRDITRGFIPDNMITAPTDTVLQLRGTGNYAIYDEVARDDQVKTCRQQRELALVAKEWDVEPGDSSRKARRAADRLKAMLEAISWDDKTTKMLSGVLYGFAVAELIWTTDGAEVALDDIKVRNRNRFGFWNNGELRLRTFDQMTTGEQLPPGKFWAFSCGADHDDDPYGLGLGHYLYWPVFFKKNGLKFWLTFLDKFAQPTAVGKYPYSAEESEKTKLLQALAAIQSSSGIRIPESMSIELIEAARSGTADYTELYDHMNAAISKVYLGHAGSTDVTPGRLGGEHHAGDVREDLIKADADLICGSFNRTVARWLTFYNDGDGVVPPRVWRNVDPPDDIKLISDTDKTLFDMGFKPTLKYITEQYGDNYEEKAPPEPIAPPGTPQALQANQATDQPAQFAENPQASDPTGIDSQTEQLAKEAAKPLQSILDTVKAKVMAADSLESLQNDLLASYGDIDTAELTSVMAIAFAAADLSGRFDISQG